MSKIGKGGEVGSFNTTKNFKKAIKGTDDNSPLNKALAASRPPPTVLQQHLADIESNWVNGGNNDGNQVQKPTQPTTLRVTSASLLDKNRQLRKQATGRTSFFRRGGAGDTSRAEIGTKVLLG